MQPWMARKRTHLGILKIHLYTMVYKEFLNLRLVAIKNSAIMNSCVVININFSWTMNSHH